MIATEKDTSKTDSVDTGGARTIGPLVRRLEERRRVRSDTINLVLGVR